jgi:hypothetical protein
VINLTRQFFFFTRLSALIGNLIGEWPLEAGEHHHVAMKKLAKKIHGKLKSNLHFQTPDVCHEDNQGQEWHVS